MAITIDPAVEAPASEPNPYLRPIVLATLLVAEALFFTIRFDAPKGLPSGSWWASVLFQSHSIVRLILLGSVAIGTFGGARFFLRARRALFLDIDSGYDWQRWFVVHGLALAGFAALTFYVCEGRSADSAHLGAWIAAWVASGVAVGASWLATLISPGSWLGFARRSKAPLLSGAAVTFAVSFASNFTNQLWDSMAWATLGMVRGMLGLISSNISFDPARRVVGADGFQVRIAYACSGYEGIALVLIFLTAYMACFRRSLRWPRAYLILPIGATLIWLLNAARIAALILIGAWRSPEIALGGFHSQAGWLAFLGVGLGLVALTRRSSFFASDLRDGDAAIASNPSMAYLGPFLAIVATSMVTGMFSTGFDRWYGLRVATGGLALWHFRRQFFAALRGCSWGAVAIGVIAFVLWVALEPASTEASRSLVERFRELPRGQGWAWILLRVVGSVAIVPLAEELAFRGYLARRLISVDFESVAIGRFSWASLLISSAAFGFLHGRWLAGMLVGVLFAVAVYRRGRLGDAVVAHATTNALIAATVLITGDWTLWS